MNEKKIIEKIKTNDMQAFELLVDTYSKKLFTIIYRFTNNYDDTEDLMQEVWLKFYKNIKNFRFQSSIYTFLYKIAVNTGLNWLRKKKRYDAMKKLLLFTNPLFSRDNSMEKLMYNDLHRILEKKLNNLSAKQKTIFILRNQDNLSFKEISSILKINVNNAKVAYHLAVKKLKSLLDKEGLI